MTGLQIQTTISDWCTQWYSDRPLTCCDLVQAVLVLDNQQLPLPRPPVIHDGWYWWSCPAAAPPPQSRDIREQESAAASHGGAHWTARPTRSWPATRRLMSLRQYRTVKGERPLTRRTDGRRCTSNKEASCQFCLQPYRISIPCFNSPLYYACQ